MPTVKALQFSQHLQQDELKPVYALVGEDDALVSVGITLLREAVERPDMPGGLVTDLDELPEPHQVFDQLRTQPFMGMKGLRMVIVRAGNAFVAAHGEALLAYLAHPSPTGLLVLCRRPAQSRKKSDKAKAAGQPQNAASPKGAAALARKVTAAIAKTGVVVECAVTKWAEARRWVDSEARKDGKTLTHQASSALVEAVGPNITMLHSELEKLILYAGDERTITEGDVEELVPESRSRSIFELSDAVAQRDAPKALHAGERLLLSGEKPERIVFFLAQQTRKLWQVQRMVSEKADQKEIERTLRLRDFAARKAIEAVRELGEEWFARQVSLLAAADAELKTTSVQSREHGVWLSVMLSKLCQ